MFTSVLQCIFNQAFNIHYKNSHISSVSNGVIASSFPLEDYNTIDLIKLIKLKQMWYNLQSNVYYSYGNCQKSVAVLPHNI